MLTSKERDTITEIINIGVGKGSAALYDMIQTEIILRVPYINVINYDGLLKEIDEIESDKVHSVELQFKGQYKGFSNIIVSSNSASTLSGLLTDMDPNSIELKEIQDGIIVEVGNIILNAIMGSFGNILETSIDFEIPKSYIGQKSNLFQYLDREKYDQILVCKTDFSIRSKNISGKILIVYEINSFNKLKEILKNLTA